MPRHVLEKKILIEKKISSFCLFLQNYKGPNYPKRIVPNFASNLHNLRRHRENWINTRTLKFRSSFFPHILNYWNDLNRFIKTSPISNIFKKRFMAYFEVSINSLYGVRGPVGVKYLTRLRGGLSHLHAHKFKHKFQDVWMYGG